MRKLDRVIEMVRNDRGDAAAAKAQATALRLVGYMDEVAENLVCTILIDAMYPGLPSAMARETLSVMEPVLSELKRVLREAQ